MWVLPVGGVVTGENQPPPSWNQAAADGVTGFPSARVGYTLTAFGSEVVLFGGVSVLSTAPVGTLPSVCFDATTAGQCEFHYHVWRFQPGNPGAAGEIVVSGSQWTHLVAGALEPPGRFDHVSGAFGDQLFVYGGSTATGPSIDLWAFNLVSQAWALVAPSSPAPAMGDAGYGVGAWMGRHLYRYAQAVSPATGEPVPGTGQLWRWAPSASGPPRPSPPSGPSPSSAPVAPPAPAGTSTGTAAGITIAILVGLANLALLLVIGHSQGALGSVGDTLCSLCGRGGNKKSYSPAGFYTSTGDKGEGAYTAPSAL